MNARKATVEILLLVLVLLILLARLAGALLDVYLKWPKRPRS
jgi:hypothetical protein